MAREIITLRYEGSSINEEGMGAYYVSGSIRGFSDFVSRIGREIYGDRVKQKTNVRNIRHGSIEIDFIQLVSDPSIQLTLTVGIDAQIKFPDLIARCFKLLKHLQGEPAVSVKYEGDKGCQVQNNSGVINNFNIEEVNIVMDPKTGTAAKKFGKKPLNDVADRMVVLSKGKIVAKAESEDANCFVPVGSEDSLIDQIIELNLTIASPVFEGRSQWRFFDGARTFPAEIEDEDFLARINSGSERFGKGDVLYARVRTLQKLSRSGLRAEYAIVKVLEHMTDGGVQSRTL
jgi:hypothetical protein